MLVRRAWVFATFRITAEGFGRFGPADNARFVEYAHASIGEVQDLLIEAKHKNYLDEEQFEQLWTRSRRALGTNTNYGKYLRRCARTKGKPWLKNPRTENLEP